MNSDEEVQFIDDLNKVELLEYFQNGLITHATGGTFEDVYYKHARTKVLAIPNIPNSVPRWIKTCRDPAQFWTFIQPKFKSYQERREFIYTEINSLILQIEGLVQSPVEQNTQFNVTYIQAQWEKAIMRKAEDPEGAITMARTLIESVLKHILDEQKIAHDENMELSILNKLVAKSLNLAPEQHQEDIFKQILGGLSGVINGLGTLRNKLGDAHGNSQLKIKPKERHAELAIGAAGTMAIFLFKTFEDMQPFTTQNSKP